MTLISITSFSQEKSRDKLPIGNFDKINNFQIVNYKPKIAKSGKDGKERFILFKLFPGPKSGTSGKDGKQGRNLKINISTLLYNDTTLLKLIITFPIENKPTDIFYINPRYGQIKIIADGGDGGHGGTGESGGGSNGSGGKGGDGGKIEVVFDSSANSFSNCKCLLFSTEGGRGGFSGEDYGEEAKTGNTGLLIYLKEENGKILLIK